MNDDNEDMFRLYWFNERTGYGHPALEFPDEYTYEKACKLVQEFKKWSGPKDCKLRYEPVELFEKYTSKNVPL